MNLLNLQTLFCCIIILLALTRSLTKADLNSGTYDDDEASLDSLTGRNLHSRQPQGNVASSVPETITGDLQKFILKKAARCKRPAQKGDTLLMHYRGTLLQGSEFDNSFKRGEPLSFTLGVGEVIKGWDMGLMGICAGDKLKLLIPPHLAYGAEGAPPDIPPKATLRFEVEAVDVVAGERKDL